MLTNPPVLMADHQKWFCNVGTAILPYSKSESWLTKSLLFFLPKQSKKNVYATTPKRLFAHLWKRFYNFVMLPQGVAHEAIIACLEFKKEYQKTPEQAYQKELSNFFQRKLYRLAKEQGWIRLSNGEWVRRELNMEDKFWQTI